jgi:hypothetical protein
VARGAVLRALRKEDGPARILQSSYGFIRDEPYLDYDAHITQVPEKDAVNGRKYLDHTIDWMIHKVSLCSENEARCPRSMRSQLIRRFRAISCHRLSTYRDRLSIFSLTVRKISSAQRHCLFLINGMSLIINTTILKMRVCSARQLRTWIRC